MKKLLLLLCVVMALAGCEKEGAGSDTRLVGTKWQTRASTYEIFYGGTCFDVYEFISASEVENYTTKNGNVADFDGTFKYKLNYPHITIYHIFSDGSTEELKFVFRDSRTMVREGENVNEYAEFMKYIRQ